MRDRGLRRQNFMVIYVWFFLRCVVEYVYIVRNGMGERKSDENINVSKSAGLKSINLNIFYPQSKLEAHDNLPIAGSPQSESKQKLESQSLTVHVQNEAGFLGLDELGVQGLAGENRVEIGSLHGRPKEPVLDDIARVVLVLVVHLKPVYKPPHLRLGTPCQE